MQDPPSLGTAPGEGGLPPLDRDQPLKAQSQQRRGTRQRPSQGQVVDKTSGARQLGSRTGIRKLSPPLMDLRFYLPFVYSQIHSVSSPLLCIIGLCRFSTLFPSSFPSLPLFAFLHFAWLGIEQKNGKYVPLLLLLFIIIHD